jgi:cell division topological specificity factor
MNVINRLLGRVQPKSRDIAKNRLQLVLVQDRVDLSPAKMDQLKDDLIQVISKYVVIEQEGVEMALSNSNHRQSRLTIDIPVIGARHR